MVYSKHLEAEHTGTKRNDSIIVVANLDPHAVRETTVHLDLNKLGLTDGDRFEVTDLITDETYTWSNSNYVRLDPRVEPVHVLKIGKVLA